MSYDNRNRRSSDRADAPTRQRRRRRRHRFTVFQVIGTLLLVMLTTCALLACFAAAYIKTVIIPLTPIDLNSFHPGLNSVLYYYDDNGTAQTLRTLHGDENRVWVNFDDIPQDLINATVAIEDRRFWTHPGIDWRRTTKAILLMFTGQDIQGGSTITQQLIKNTTTYNETTVKRKVVEIFRALEFNKNYSKETTLEWYLNYIYLGHGCDGVYTASYMYFGKPLSELTTAECASLISITNNPSLYDPYTNPENNESRKNLVLRAMLDQGYLNQEEYGEAKAQKLVFTSSAVETEQSSEGSNVYSWYEEQVITDVTADLAEHLGITQKMAYDMVLSGGLSIYTCVDPSVQSAVEKIYENQQNFNWPARSGQQLQSAITVIDNSTGDVVGMAGQVGEKTGDRLRNNATAAYRQPGSSFKPLAVYAPAIELGLATPITVVDDYPYELNNNSPYPVNSGNERYKGLTTVYSGLTHSVNTIAFRMLTDMVTPAASYNFVQEKFKIPLEFQDLDRAPLSMGGLTKGVNTRSMAEAFSVFPNQGIYTPSRTYTKVLNANGDVILENTTTSEAVLKNTTAYYMNTMLQNVVTSGTGYEAAVSGMHVAGKTGSSTSDKDRWFAGYTPYYTAVVWTGYPSPERVRSNGKNPAAITFSRVMSAIHSSLPDKEFFKLNDLVTTEYCLDSGLLPTDLCRTDPRGSRVATMALAKDDVPTGYCTMHSEQSTVTVCTGSPILNANGEPTGHYHLAGEYCPQEDRMTINLLDYARQPVGSAVASDEVYTIGYYEAQGTCTVHTTAPEPPSSETPIPPVPQDPNTDFDLPPDPSKSLFIPSIP